MIRTIKALGLAVVAVLAMSAFFANTASATTIGTFTCNSYLCEGTGEQVAKHVFTVQGQKVECNKAHFSGSIADTSHTIKVIPKYEECTAFGLAATVSMNSCYYDFTTGTTHNSPTHYYTGTVHIRCTTSGDSITVSAGDGSCVVHIHEQTPTIHNVDYENLDPTGSGVLVTSTVSGIHSTVTKNNFLCPVSSATTDTTGTYTRTVNFLPLGGNTIHVS